MMSFNSFSLYSYKLAVTKVLTDHTLWYNFSFVYPFNKLVLSMYLMPAAVTIVVKLLLSWSFRFIQEVYGMLNGKCKGEKCSRFRAGNGCKGGQCHSRQGWREGALEGQCLSLPPSESREDCQCRALGGESVWVSCRSNAEAALAAKAERSNSRGLIVQARERMVGRGGYWHHMLGFVGFRQDAGFHCG